MIPGFEETTKPLSATEQFATRYVADMLRQHVGKENAVNNHKLCQYVYDKIQLSTTNRRMRKIINHIRITPEFELTHLCASSNGYYLACNKEELSEYIESLNHRASAIRHVEKMARKALINIYPTKEGKQTQLGIQ